MLKKIFRRKQKELISIGYWQSEEESFLPNPLSFVDENWELNEKRKVIEYLKRGEILMGYRGTSWCRFHCGHIGMGSKDLTDGKYVWPEGFVHYVEYHNVKPPSKFVDRSKEHKIDLSKEELIKLEELNRSDKWWIKLGQDLKVNDRIIKYSNGGIFSIGNIKESSNPEVIKFLKRFKRFWHLDEIEITSIFEKETEIEIKISSRDMDEIRKEGEKLKIEFIFKPQYIK